MNSKLTKAERLEYMRRRFPVLDEQADAVIPVTKYDLKDELDLIDAVREHTRDEQTNQELTSDAV